MSQMSEWFLETARQPATVLLLDITVKGTVLVLLAMLVLRLLPRSSAALRHWVWSLMFCSLIVLPALGYLLPAWTIPILPAWEEAHPPLAEAREIAAAPTEVTDPLDAARPNAANALSNGDRDLMADRQPIVAPTPERIDHIANESPATKSAVVEAVLPESGLLDPSPGALITASILWAIGAAVALLPLLAGLLRSALLRTKAQSVHDVSWTALRDQLSGRLGLKRSVRLLAVKSPIIPLSCGIVRPAVILPSDSYHWNEPLRRFVLLHELAHVKRHDVVFQLIARLACVLYWFHPLVWYAMHRLRIERELACDDAVLAAGERASDYAEQLLEVARRLQPLRLHAAVAMAQSNKLEYRVGTLFSRARSHLPLSTRASRLLLACAAAIVVAVSVVRPSARATDEEHHAKEQQPVPAKEVAAPTEKMKLTKIEGRVVAVNGRPVEGARLLVVRVTSAVNTHSRQTEVLTETATDGEGRFEVPYPPDSPNSDFYLFAAARGHGLTWDHGQSARAGKECLLKLAPDDVPIEGRVLDLEGQPIAGVQVAVRSITATADDIDEWVTRAQSNPAQGLSTEERYAYAPRPDPIARFPAQDRLELEHPKLVYTASTDADGRFRLTGLGGKRLVRLEVSGAGVAKGWINAVTHPMEAVPYPEYDPRYRFSKCFGSRFDVSVEPELRIAGVARDASTREPLAGVEVRLQTFARYAVGDDQFAFDVTDAGGRYELNGIPRPGDRGKLTLRAVPSAEQPYFRTDLDVSSTSAQNTISCDVELKRAIWIRGRVLDQRTGNPVPGEIAYYPLLSNDAAKDYANFNSGVQGIGGQYHYTIAADGSFRIPGLPGRGILTFLADEDTRYPRAQGADDIGGLRRRNSSQPRKVYYFMSADFVNAVREVNVPGGADEFTCDIQLDPFTPHTLRLLDPDGKPLSGASVEGLNSIPIRGLRGGSALQTSANVDLFGLAEDQPRFVKFIHQDRRLAGFARLSVEDFPSDKPKDVTLLPAAEITARLVDERGQPISGATGFVSLDLGREKDPRGRIGRWRQSVSDTAGSDGRIRIEFLPSGVKYKLNASHSLSWVNAVSPVRVLGPGEKLDLGDITLNPIPDVPRGAQSSSAKSASPVDPKSNKRPDEMQKPRENRKESNFRASSTGGNEQATIVRGQITGPEGNAAAGAHVAAITRRIIVDRGAELDPDGVVLAEAKADDDGQYRLTITGASSKTHHKAFVLARSDTSALAWQTLNLDAAEVDASFELKPATTLTGRLVDLEGQPAANVRFNISAIRPAVVENQLLPGGIDFWRTIATPAAWPQPVTSDQEGRFSISGVPEGHGVYVTVHGDDRFARQDIAINTGMAEQRGKNDATYRPQVNNAKGKDDIVVPLAPAQVFTGRVTYEDTGEAAAHAPMQIWASQKQYGSMIALGGKADAQGNYRISPYAGTYFGVTAYAPPNAPYLTRTIERIPWDSATGTKEVNITLPRGVIVRGQIVEEGAGRPVAGASIQYHPEDVNNPNIRDDIRTGWQAIEVTDSQGRFQIVVLPGAGRLLVHGPEGGYVLRQTTSGELYRGTKGGRRIYAHAVERIDPAKGSEPLDVTIRLQPAGKASGVLVDEQGRSIDESLLVTRLHVFPFWIQWRGSPRTILGGHFEQGGLAPDTENPVHFLDPKRRLGATVMLKAGAEPLRVVLKQCGQASIRFVDENGKPVADRPSDARLVVTPGPLDWNRGENESELTADEDFVSNIDRLNHGTLKTDAAGRVTLPALIPGATYRVLTVKDEKLIIAKEFQAKAGETIELGDIVYQKSDK